MRNLGAVLLLAAFLAVRPTRAQDVTPPAPEPEVRQGRERPSPRLLLVIDVSGSMHGMPIGTAIQQAVELAFMPSDDVEVGVIVFNETHRLIEGPTGPGSFWYRMPSEPNEERLRAAITTLGAGGNTDPSSAMHAALLMQAQTVVLITDGGFVALPVLYALGNAYLELEARGDPRPRLGIIGIGAKGNHLLVLEQIATMTGAELQTCEPPAPPEPEPLLPPYPGHRFPPIGPPPIFGPY